MRLYKRGRIWWAWGYDAQGRRWARSTRQTDRRAADQVARTFDRKAVDGAPDPLPVEQAMIDVIEAREAEGKAARTIANYRLSGGHLCRVLGAETDVHEVTRVGLDAYVRQRLLEGAMRSTAAIELGALKSALMYAEQRGRFVGSVGAIWPRELLAKAHVPRDRYLTREEFQLLHDNFTPRTKHRRDYLLAYVLTGVRRRELHTITTDGVDLGRGMMHVRGTKNARADRWLPIHAQLRPVVERRLATAARGEPLWPEWWTLDALHQASARAGIERVTCHDLRRTFASWMAQAGVPMLVTARMLGHGSTKMTERVYAHVGADDMRLAIDRLPTVANASQTPAASAVHADASDTAEDAKGPKNA